MFGLCWCDTRYSLRSNQIRMVLLEPGKDIRGPRSQASEPKGSSSIMIELNSLGEVVPRFNHKTIANAQPCCPNVRDLPPSDQGPVAAHVVKPLICELYSYASAHSEANREKRDADENNKRHPCSSVERWDIAEVLRVVSYISIADCSAKN